MSSLHPDVSIEANEKKTPETIAHYNKTKYGVDVLDQMLRQYSTKAASRRWPVQAVYNILAIAGVNPYIKENFSSKLAEELYSEYRKIRSSAQESENYI